MCGAALIYNNLIQFRCYIEHSSFSSILATWVISVWYCLKYWSHDRFPCLIYYKASVFVRCIYVATRDQVAAHQCGSMRSLPLLIWNLCLDGGSWWITMLDSSSIYVPLLLLLHPLPKITATVSFYKKFCFAPVRNHSSLLCPSLSCRMHNPLYQCFAIPLSPLYYCGNVLLFGELWKEFLCILGPCLNCSLPLGNNCLTSSASSALFASASKSCTATVAFFRVHWRARVSLSRHRPGFYASLLWHSIVCLHANFSKFLLSWALLLVW